MNYAVFLLSFMLAFSLVRCGSGINMPPLPTPTVSYIPGPAGSPGPQGIPGPAGSPGPQGLTPVIAYAPASLTQCPGGGVIMIVTTNVTVSSIICNGVNGVSPSPSPYTPTGVITPCGPNSSPYKEVLLLLQDGSLLSSFSDTASGSNTRFALLPDGSYEDTDASHCAFTISTSGKIRSITWTGGGESWTIP